MALTLEAEQPPLRIDEHGVCRVGGTRVTLETILASFHQGATPEAIADQYPTVALADIYATIAYYLRHQDEVGAYLRDVEAAEAATIREIRARQPVRLRERLLGARKPVSQ